MNGIDEEFKNYLVACYGKNHNLPSVQYKEIRQAFYAGALESFNLAMNVSQEEDEDKATELMEGLHNSILEGIKAGISQS